MHQHPALLEASAFLFVLGVSILPWQAHRHGAFALIAALQ